MSKGSVCIIGAGISGLICARTLADAGFRVRVFEKSRGVGGRMSTRREGDETRFDHGAPYFTVQGDRFRSFVDRWVEQGVVQRWQGGIVEIYRGKSEPESRPVERFVAVPGMNGICRHLADGLDIRFDTRVAPPEPDGGRWTVRDDLGAGLGQFDQVVVTAPAPQATELLAAAPLLAKRAGRVEMPGTWVVMAAFLESLNLPFDAGFIHASPLSWVSKDSGKPGRTALPECWVLQATPAWSAEHFEKKPETVAERLLEVFMEETGQEPVTPMVARAHRWRYAVPPEPHPGPFLLDEKRGIGACGDWCGGPRVEGAFLSGILLAERLCELA